MALIGYARVFTDWMTYLSSADTIDRLCRPSREINHDLFSHARNLGAGRPTGAAAFEARAKRGSTRPARGRGAVPLSTGRQRWPLGNGTPILGKNAGADTPRIRPALAKRVAHEKARPKPGKSSP